MAPIAFLTALAIWLCAAPLGVLALLAYIALLAFRCLPIVIAVRFFVAV